MSTRAWLLVIRYVTPEYKAFGAWSVGGFEAVRVYYVVEDEVLRVIRILHGKRNVRRILEREKF